MPKRHRLNLTEAAIAELEKVRDSHPKPYMREKAAALLKIAAGQSPHAVAVSGLLKRRRPDTLYDWLDRYKTEGIAGLLVRKGRGRKPSFSP